MSFGNDNIVLQEHRALTSKDRSFGCRRCGPVRCVTNVTIDIHSAPLEEDSSSELDVPIILINTLAPECSGISFEKKADGPRASATVGAVSIKRRPLHRETSEGRSRTRRQLVVAHGQKAQKTRRPVRDVSIAAAENGLVGSERASPQSSLTKQMEQCSDSRQIEESPAGAQFVRVN